MTSRFSNEINKPAYRYLSSDIAHAIDYVFGGRLSGQYANRIDFLLNGQFIKLKLCTRDPSLRVGMTVVIMANIKAFLTKRSERSHAHRVLGNALNFFSGRGSSIAAG
jgi:hypothetical protein